MDRPKNISEIEDWVAALEIARQTARPRREVTELEHRIEILERDINRRAVRLGQRPCR